MKLLRFPTALALTVASALVFTGCGGDDPDSGTNPPADTGPQPFDGGSTDNGNPVDTGVDTGMPGDTGMPRDAGDAGDTGDTGIVQPPCAAGTEGCACTSTAAVSVMGEVTLPFARSDCNQGLICVPWDVVSGRNFDTSPDNDLTGAVQSCIKPCNVDNDCGAGRFCQDSFFVEGSGIKRYCVDERADYGQFCGTNKLVISRLPGVTKETDHAIGCPVGTNCQISQFNDVHPDEGLCLEFCTEREPNCPTSAPVCNPRIFASTSTTDPFVGVCNEFKRGPGSTCFDKPESYVGLVQICDTTGGIKTGCLGTDIVPNMGGFCVQRCDAASPCAADPSGLPVSCSTQEIFNPSTPPQPTHVCNVACNSFPETCPSTGGGQGQGWFCNDFPGANGDPPIVFCFDRYPNALSPASLNADGTLAGAGDDCFGDIENYSFYRCPTGSHCEGFGDGTGGCLFGCNTTSSTTGDAFCTANATGTTTCIDGVIMGAGNEALGFCGPM